MKKGIIFDLDGVIVDTAKYHYLAWKNLAQKWNYDFTPKENELLKGVSRVKSLEILLEKAGIQLNEEEKQKALIEKNDEYLKYIEKLDQNEMLPGILALINWLEKEKIPFALGSASKNAPAILDKLGIKNKFSAIVDGNNVQKAKPDPEVFLQAAEKLGLEPAECIVIEDAQAGIEAAKKAGMTAVAIGKKLQNADYNLEDTAQLTPEFISEIVSTN